jgi:prevent-host-death family protein
MGYTSNMKIMQVGELKAQFSKVLESVQQGEEVIISRGRKRENIAVIIPFSEYKEKNRVKLGSLKGKATYKIKSSYKMTAEELLAT